ncbi:hypothetical protein PAMC26577_35865 [Caballeronia sordidicola]|uniref:Uncharacterized protein n=1 Tax=Caballeronia sordidicola TaxID=196367 RepID=A0A242M9C5_CABSO|nr:hypothetical protein PAMC26577_35865 [Caballeronia sordidicola]
MDVCTRYSASRIHGALAYIQKNRGLCTVAACNPIAPLKGWAMSDEKKTTTAVVGDE